MPNVIDDYFSITSKFPALFVWTSFLVLVFTSFTLQLKLYISLSFPIVFLNSNDLGTRLARAGNR